MWWDLSSTEKRLDCETAVILSHVGLLVSQGQGKLGRVLRLRAESSRKVGLARHTLERWCNAKRLRVALE